MEVVYCLRLAKLLGLTAGDVLRAAQKPDEAALIEELCGCEPGPRPMADAELLRLLSPAEQNAVETLIRALVDAKRRTPSKRRFAPHLPSPPTLATG